jgi:hypothetical protein
MYAVLHPSNFFAQAAAHQRPELRKSPFVVLDGEPNTPYADWPPLSESSDEMTINRWYGIYFERDPACSVCGDFVGTLATSYGLDASSFVVPSGRGDA